LPVAFPQIVRAGPWLELGIPLAIVLGVAAWRTGALAMIGLLAVAQVFVVGWLAAAPATHALPRVNSFVPSGSASDLTLGAVNTVVLILSSFTMALAVYSAQLGRRRNQIICLLATITLGLTFLGIKAVEYHDKYEDSLIPGRLIPGRPFNPEVQEHGTPYDKHKLHLLPGATVKNVEMFYWIYFAMTGMHAIHMIIGVGLLSVILFFAWRGRYGPEYHNPVEISGLYWHFVDIIWIFLFPLLYLLGRHLEHL
jgi:cytochrome c oxidase subunit 3